MAVKMAIADSADIIVSGEAGTGAALLDLLKTASADIILLDVGLPDMSGIEIARRMKKDYPAVKILAISAENTGDTVRALLDAGIEGFISKQSGEIPEIIRAIHSVMDGNEYFGNDISTIIYKIYVSKQNATADAPKFTDREREIIRYCRDGLQVKEIADRLGITPATVNTHKNNIFKKLGINNQMEMVQYALKHGIISITN
jgi:DNA-binding NarL/FixJ family response regulator